MEYVRKCIDIHFGELVCPYYPWAYLTGNMYGPFIRVYIPLTYTSWTYLPGIVIFDIYFGNYIF